MNISLEEAWKSISDQLRKDGIYYKSLIKEIPDDVWSLAKRNTAFKDEELINWFNSEIPAFDNKRLIDIAISDGEEESLDHPFNGWFDISPIRAYYWQRLKAWFHQQFFTWQPLKGFYLPTLSSIMSASSCCLI